MGDINLLPQELKPNRTVLKLSSRLKTFALLGTILLLVLTVLYFASSFFLDQRISTSLKEQDNLKNQIKALEETEQRLILVKDRLTKISSVSTKPSVDDELERLKIVSGLFPEGTSFEKAELSENNAGVVVASDNLDSVAGYLASVVASGKYVRVNLQYLNFDPESGYSIGLSFPE